MNVTLRCLSDCIFSSWRFTKMTTFCKLFVIIFFCIDLTRQIYGLEQTRLNTNTANVNLLLSESGRDRNFGTYPLLPHSSPNGQNGNVQSPGRVHDLVNFYNNQDKGTSAPSAKPFSYSSAVSGIKPGNVVQGAQLNQGTNMAHQIGSTHTSPQNIPLNPTIHIRYDTTPPKTLSSRSSTKPSFSEIVYGENRSPNPASNTNINPRPAKPTTKPSFSSIVGGAGGNSRPTSLRPNSNPSPTNAPVMPSAIVSNYRQGQRPVNGNIASDLELQTLSEELLRKDTNNAASLITINYQQKTTSQSKDDKASLPLISFPDPDSLYNITTIKKFVALLDNYERDTQINEYVTPLERNEENDFMEVVMQTQVIRQLMKFLKDKDYVTPDPKQQRDFLKQMWFNLYSRGKGKIGSSGFEHVFVSELKNGEISGLHNWLYFAREESANRANYLGYLKYEQLGDKGAVLKHHFTQQGTDKPVDSMFIGTSPELEMALYSLCFITRADQSCPLKLGGKNVNIVTHTFRYRSKNLIGSAYPQI